MKIFKDNDSKIRFVELYETLSDSDKRKFGQIIRHKAEEKITKLDNLEEFYLDELDVKNAYDDLI